MLSRAAMMVARSCRSRAVPATLRASAPLRFMSTEAGKADPGQTAEQVAPFHELIRDFLSPSDFHRMLERRGVNFFTGVPDSLLKDVLGYISDTVPPERHIITANEGSAVALAAGYHMGSRKIPLVYLQNSGLGNVVNPLLSLADPKVYSIPMLLLVGWRGEPGKRDEPQHRVQGALTPGMLASMNVSFEVLPDFKEGAEEVLDTAFQYMHARSAPYVLLVKRQTFEQYRIKKKPESDAPMTREQFLESFMPQMQQWDTVVATTGFTSREVYELREKRGEGHERDFLTVGSMGHSSAIALGLAVAKPSRRIVCLDGDGSMLMHMGTLATIGSAAPFNLLHVVVNNAAHESVGGQATACDKVDIAGAAKACGYRRVMRVETEEELKEAMSGLGEMDGPALLEVKVRMGTRADLGRPKTTPMQNRDAFMRFLNH